MSDKRNAAQEAINACAGREPLTRHLLKVIVDMAADQNAKFPQYEGAWSGPEWQLGKIRRQIRTKFGTPFQAGDVIVFADRRTDTGAKYVTAYSVRNAINTAIPYDAIDLLATFLDAPGAIERV